MKESLRRLWFRSNQAVEAHLFEWYFRRTSIGRSIRVREEEVVFSCCCSLVTGCRVSVEEGVSGMVIR